MRLFRSLLFCPANHQRRVDKALALAADAVILDLEDAVATSEKIAARVPAVAALGATRRGRLYVRVNDAASDYCYGDLVSVVLPGLDGIVLPKVESVADLRTVEWVVASLERERELPGGSVDIIPLIETGKGIVAAGEIAGAGTRARRLAFGAVDLALDLGMTLSPDEGELLPFRSGLVTASRAAGIEPPIDTVWTELANGEGCAGSAARAKALGFQGKLCIHPDQIPLVNDAFSPSQAEIDTARRVVTAFREAEARGLASIRSDGQFIDYPVAYRAQRILAAAGNGEGAPA